MTTDAIAPDSGVLSLDQATALLGELPRKDAPAETAEAAPAEVETEQNPQAEPTAEEADGPEEAPEGDSETEKPEDDAEVEKPEQPALEPPKFWDAEAKKRFGELPQDIQKIILSKEDERNTATSKALQEAAERRKAFEAEASKLTQLTAGLDQILPQAIQTFQSRWANVDWDKVVDTYGADQALKLKNQYEVEQRQVQQMQFAKDAADQHQFKAFVEAESAKLPELVPDLADPKLGSERKAELGKFLVSSGIPADRIPYMTALEASIAWKALKWDQAQAKAKTLAAAPKTAAPPKRAPAKPGAAITPRSTQQARVEQLNRKPSLTIDEAVELANLRESPQP